MILYTPVPIESVLNQNEDTTYEYFELDYHGVTLVMEPIDSYQAKIVRLISSNPNDYLNPSYTPGNILRFKPE